MSNLKDDKNQDGSTKKHTARSSAADSTLLGGHENNERQKEYRTNLEQVKEFHKDLLEEYQNS